MLLPIPQQAAQAAAALALGALLAALYDFCKAFRLREGDSLYVRRAEAKTRLIRLTNRSFYEIVTQKLGRM